MREEASASGDGAVHGHKVEFARRLLRGAILSREVASGGSLTHGEPADALGISRTPLRETIRVVQGEGILASEPNRTVCVAGFSAEDLVRRYALRIINEDAIVRSTIPALTADEMSDLRAHVAKMAAFASEQDLDRHSGPHRALHALLIAGRGERAAGLSAQLFDHSERHRRAWPMSHPRPYDLPGREHQAMLEAAIDQDGARCARELVAQYQRNATGVIEQRDPGAELPQVELACAVALGPPDLTAAAVPRQAARDRNSEHPE